MLRKSEKLCLNLCKGTRLAESVAAMAPSWVKVTWLELKLKGICQKMKRRKNLSLEIGLKND
jgi:hypothetical protein